MPDNDLLFQPLDIAGCHIENRIVMAPMTRGFAPDGILTPASVDYYRRRAEGGVGLILTEGAAVNAIGAWSKDIPSLFGAAALSAWQPVVEAVHGVGGRIMAQLWHTGLGRIQAAGHDPQQLSEGPSDEYPPSPGAVGSGSFGAGKAMTQADINATIDDYTAAAEAAKKLGFDGIELHAAHGYLIDQFFWSESNRRMDGYNGEIAARVRFAVELIGEIRRNVGAQFPIGLRFSQWKLPDRYSEKPLSDPADLAAFLEPLTAAGIDFFDCSTRRFWDPAFEPGGLTLAGWTKKISGKITMAVGSVGLDSAMETSAAHIGDIARPQSLDRLLGLFQQGEFDLVGVGRALIANPDWADAMRTGDLGRLRAYDIQALSELV